MQTIPLLVKHASYSLRSYSHRYELEDQKVECDCNSVLPVFIPEPDESD
jgi:hypothetical protein